MAKQNSTIGLVWSAIGAAIIAALLFAPIYYIYLLFKKTPKLAKNIDDYKLTDNEEQELKSLNRQIPELIKDHLDDLNKGLRLTKSGEFDQRSRDGQSAAATKKKFEEMYDEKKTLVERPLKKLNNAISGRKIKVSASVALVVLSIVLIGIKHLNDQSEVSSGFFANYMISTVISVVAFAGIWIVASIWYWFFFRELRTELEMLYSEEQHDEVNSKFKFLGIGSFILIILGAIFYVFSAEHGNSSIDRSIGESHGAYVFTANRLFTKQDCKKYDSNELKLVRNEIYARYGYAFKDQDLRNYFNEQKWYKETKTDVAGSLSEMERENVKLIIECENGK